MRASCAIQVATLAALPAAIAVTLTFGGGQVQRCLALRCPPPPPRPIRPLIGTTEPAVALAGVLAVVWVAIALAAIGRLLADDRPRLARIIGLQVVVCAAIGLVAAAAMRLEGHRWRSVAETAVLAAALTAYVVLPLLLGWAAATRRPRGGCA